MISRLLGGAAAAIVGLGAVGAHAQGCIGPGPCPGGYAPASPAYVFQPGPTPAYQGGTEQGYGPAPYGAPLYAQPGGYGQSLPPAPYDRYGGEYAHGPAPQGYAPQAYAPQGYAPYPQPQPGPQVYNYVPAFGRGVYADRPYNGPGPGYDARGGGACGGDCASAPVPAFQPCAAPCGYPGPVGYAVPSEGYAEQPAPVAYQAEAAPAVAVSSDFFYGLSGGTGGFPEGSGGGGYNSQGFGAETGFGLSSVNTFYNNYANATVAAQLSAVTAANNRSNVNVNVNNVAYANANANAYAKAYAMNQANGHNKVYGHPMPSSWGGGVGSMGMGGGHKGCNCGAKSAHH